MISRWWWGPKTAGELWHKDRNVRSFDGTCVRYTRLGSQDAPVVALCAGFLCPDTYWRYLVPGLVERFRVLFWNYRGVGVKVPVLTPWDEGSVHPTARRAGHAGRHPRSPARHDRRRLPHPPDRVPGRDPGRARPLLKGSSPWFPPGRDREPLAPRPRSRDWSPPPAPRARWPARPGRARARRRRR